ncbi:MAG: hypothetical protein KGI64_09270 [Xanthomonadaceae bacterium]|nr:hypothetical protein [Xanthomonadaceae bacterium]
MKPRIGFWVAVFLLSFCATAAGGTFSRATLARLAALPPAHALIVTGFPAGPSHSATVRFERAEIYAPGAHLYVIGANDKQEVPRSNLIFLRGYSDDGSVRVALSLNPDGSFNSGSGDGPDGSFVLGAAVTASGAVGLAAKSLESAIPAGTKLNFTCGNEFENLDARGLNKLLQHPATSNIAATATASHTLRIATVAVDTDSAFMSNLFNNNATSAGNWIAKMFNTMNTMYERDLLVNLLQGNTIYRTVPASDPYASSGAFPVTAFPADSTDLSNFGSYWAANETGVTRSFATLLSGKGQCNGSSCSASGIAWIDSYCRTASNGGSYSLVMLFPNLSFDPNATIAARLDGHELGHNFGAYHTHCTNASNGAAPTGTNTIDQCVSGEVDGSTACYSGPTSCPTSGPGAPAGTIMSYCNTIGCGGGQNVLQFYPSQATVLSGYVAAQSSCLNETDDIFYDGFEN